MYTDKSRSTHADFVLQRQLTLIGRQTPATWRIKHPTISRAHGAVVWDGAELWLIDFFSSNGTRVGENRCDARLVEVGQEFRVGAVTCHYLEIQGAVAGAAQDQASGGVDSSDGSSTRRHIDDLARHRVDAPQRQADLDLPPLLPPGRSGRVVRASAPDFPPVSPTDKPLSEAAPAALVETRTVAGDTKFVDRPQRSLEDRLAVVEAELAAQREQAAGRVTRIDADLAKLRQEVERLEAALRHERESDLEHRTQVAELRERVLRELAQIGEQTQLVRQACDARPWEESLARLADDTVRRCAELERQVRGGLQSAADKLATVEGTMIAKMVELRSRQEAAPDHGPAGSDDPESVLSVEPLTEDWPAQEDHAPHDAPRGAAGASGRAGANIIEWRPENVGSKRPAMVSGAKAADGSPQWLLGEDFTDRLVDFQAKRERSAWLRRLLLTGTAVISALAIAVAASALRGRLQEEPTAESGKTQQQAEKSKPAEVEAD